jgi:hypothetical protein
LVGKISAVSGPAIRGSGPWLKEVETPCSTFTSNAVIRVKSATQNPFWPKLSAMTAIESGDTKNYL